MPAPAPVKAKEESEEGVDNPPTPEELSEPVDVAAATSVVDVVLGVDGAVVLVLVLVLVVVVGVADPATAMVQAHSLFTVKLNVPESV
jgi:hypothetical protein